MTLSKYTIISFTFLASLLGITSCSTTLELPDTNAHMRLVYLLKYSTWGHHSLGFYEDGKFTEYTYGDWQLFALNQRDSWTAWKNMTFPTQGALGKKSIEIKPGEAICDKFVGCEAVVSFSAPKDKVANLMGELKQEYEKGLKSEILNKKEGVFFVKHQDPYWGLHNCNHELVEWLEVLGANVSGRVFYNPTFIDGMRPKQKLITLLP